MLVILPASVALQRLQGQVRDPECGLYDKDWFCNARAVSGKYPAMQDENRRRLWPDLFPDGPRILNICDRHDWYKSVKLL